MNPPLILVGTVTRAQGLRGGLRVVPYLKESEAYESLNHLILESEGRRETRAVRSCRLHGRFLILELEGVEDRTAAEALAGTRLYVERSQLRELEEGEFYKEDLLGAAVSTVSGRDLGRVTDFIDTGSNDVLVVKGGQEEHLIPLVRWAVKEVDLEAGTITVVEPEELYEKP